MLISKDDLEYSGKSTKTVNNSTLNRSTTRIIIAEDQPINMQVIKS